METSLPVAERPRRPEWMKVRAPSRDGSYFDVQKLLHGQRLHTICEEARCPNIAECWGGGTATVMLMGEVCTRACRFCHVKVGAPPPLDPDEPEHLALAVGQLPHPGRRLDPRPLEPVEIDHSVAIDGQGLDQEPVVLEQLDVRELWISPHRFRGPCATRLLARVTQSKSATTLTRWRRPTARSPISVGKEFSRHGLRDSRKTCDDESEFAEP